jgi:hypothetical protein
MSSFEVMVSMGEFRAFIENGFGCTMSETKLPDDFWTVEIDVDPFAMNPEVGADLALIEAHASELESLVRQMWEDMTTETKILDGTEIPDREDIVLPRITEEEFRALLARPPENEPSHPEETKE